MDGESPSKVTTCCVIILVLAAAASLLAGFEKMFTVYANEYDHTRDERRDRALQPFDDTMAALRKLPGRILEQGAQGVAAARPGKAAVAHPSAAAARGPAPLGRGPSRRSLLEDHRLLSIAVFVGLRIGLLVLPAESPVVAG